MDLYDTIMFILLVFAFLAANYIYRQFHTSEKAKLATSRIFLQYTTFKYAVLTLFVGYMCYLVATIVWEYYHFIGNLLWISAAALVFMSLGIMAWILRKR